MSNRLIQCALSSALISAALISAALISAALLSTASVSAASPVNSAEDNMGKAKSFAATAERFGKEQSYEEAAAMMQKALQLDPKNAYFHSRLSDFLFAAQDDDMAALKEIDLAISIQKTPRADFLSTKSIILERLKRYQEAIVCSNKVIALKSVGVTAKSSYHARKMLAYYYNQRASIRKNMNDLQGAVSDLTLAIQLDPEANDLYVHRAQVNAMQKHWAQVIPDAERISKLSFKGAPVLRKREAYLLLARAHTGLKNVEKAKSTYLVAMKECVDDRLILNEAQKYFASIGDKKNADSVKKRLDSLDQDYVPFK